MHGHGEHGIAGVLTDAVMITGFVFVMMLVVEYINVLSRGRFHIKLSERRWQQYLLAAVLGAVPGCLGSFAVVGLYAHRVVSLGAVVCAMIVTTGDEAFLMLARIPVQAVLLTAGLTVLGLAAGGLTDMVVRGRRSEEGMTHDFGFEVHEAHLECFAKGRIIEQWKQCSPARGVLGVGLTLFAIAAAIGGFEAHAQWVKVTLVAASVAAVFIVATVPDHFLDEHLWAHVARQHVPRVFLWAVGALVLLAFLTERLDTEHLTEGGRWFVLVVACLVGLIPQSGPHYVFIMLYADGTLPLAVLVANSIVQEGHGMLPMLAHSRGVFLSIKALKLVMGLAIGALLLLA